MVWVSLYAERTAGEAHSTLCALVTTRATASCVWSMYASVLLDAETAAFFTARLEGAQAGAWGGAPKLCSDSDTTAKGVATICESCGGAKPPVSLHVACLDIHSTLCALVTTRAAASRVWSMYAPVLLDAETKAFFAARLEGAQAGASGDRSNPPPKKRKLHEAEDEAAAAVTVICEHCGGLVPAVSLRVACLDGTTLEVAVAQRGMVREVKRMVGQVRDRQTCGCQVFTSDRCFTATNDHPTFLVISAQLRDIDPGLIELFVDGKEDGLPDAGRLDALGLGAGSVVFMLHRLGWRWEMCGSSIVLSEEGLVATKGTAEYGWQMATGGELMTKGRHYWEVEARGDPLLHFVGAARPDRGHDKCTNLLFSTGFAECDRIGVLLDLDAGWMRFYGNGKLCKEGFCQGVAGPLVRAVGLGHEGVSLVVLPGAVAPEGAGGAVEDHLILARRYGCGDLDEDSSDESASESWSESEVKEYQEVRDEWREVRDAWREARRVRAGGASKQRSLRDCWKWQ